MIVEFHTPQGVILVNSESVTDNELNALKMTRQTFEKLVEIIPYNLSAELDDLRARVKKLETRIEKLGV